MCPLKHSHLRRHILANNLHAIKVFEGVIANLRTIALKIIDVEDDEFNHLKPLVEVKYWYWP